MTMTSSLNFVYLKFKSSQKIYFIAFFKSYRVSSVRGKFGTQGLTGVGGLKLKLQKKITMTLTNNEDPGIFKL